MNITIETDEDDLLGGFRLVNGETNIHVRKNKSIETHVVPNQPKSIKG